MIRLRNIFFILLPLAVFFLFSCSNRNKHEFLYVPPEIKGFSPEKLELLSAHLESSASSALMILVDGYVVYDWGDTRKKHVIHSIRKALLNSLYGISIEKGIIDTTLTLRALNIEDIEPGLSEKELDARVIDLLKSRSGVYHDAAGVSKGMLIGKPERNAFLPGEHFYYNNWDFNVLGEILERESGESVYELFRKEIAEPLGMFDYRGKYSSIDGESEDAQIPGNDGFYQFEKSKSKYPAYHFRMSARDLALYGQLYLNKGAWEGQQIIPENWVSLSTQPHSLYNEKYNIAYGMLWYVRGDSFYHTGAGVHMLAIYPGSRMVVVHRVDTENQVYYNKNDLYKMIGLIFDAKQ